MLSRRRTAWHGIGPNCMEIAADTSRNMLGSSDLDLLSPLMFYLLLCFSGWTSE